VTVLGQDGDRTSPFMVQYQKAENRWALCLMTQDSDNPVCAKALSASPPTVA